MKKVSVIICCFNAAAWVRHSYDSIVNQTMNLGDIECIFVDDASTDDGATWNVLTEIEKEAPESVMLIHLDENMRQGGARNIAMQYMTGKYMMFLDSDDLLRPETCQELYDMAEEADTDMIQFQHDIVWRSMDDVSIPERGPEEEGAFCDLENLPDLRKLLLSGVLGGFGCTNKFYRAEFVRQVGCTFAEHVVYEEPKFVFPLFLYARRMKIVETKYYIYRKHFDSTMNSELGVRLLEHPKVQLQLMEELVQKKDIYEKYKEEIDFNFVHCFFTETLLFSVINQGHLPLDYYQEMVRLLRAYVPDAENNPYVKEHPHILRSVEGSRVQFNNEDELKEFASEIKSILG